MGRWLVMVAYACLIACGVITLLGAPSPTFERQGGGALTLTWGSLCVIAGCVAVVSAVRRARPWEILGALFGASAVAGWVGSLILQGVKAQTLNTASATCMGTALTALLAYRAWCVAWGDEGV